MGEQPGQVLVRRWPGTRVGLGRPHITCAHDQYSNQVCQRIGPGQKDFRAGLGSTYEVNGAQVACGGVPTASATVYIISNVLMPKS